jgi:excisionase family DNA binding protein
MHTKVETMTQPNGEQLLTPAQVASIFCVDPKTVTRWAEAGKLTAVRTLGGHRRYLAHEVHALATSQSRINKAQNQIN